MKKAVGNGSHDLVAGQKATDGEDPLETGMNEGRLRTPRSPKNHVGAYAFAARPERRYIFGRTKSDPPPETVDLGVFYLAMDFLDSRDSIRIFGILLTGGLSFLSRFGRETV
jgi:hypothetical protein